MGGQWVPAAMGTAAEGEIEALRRGLGRDGIPIPAYETLGIDMRSVEAGTAVVRVPASPYLTAPDGGLLPGTFAVLADACCGAAIVSSMTGGGATLTAQLRVEFIRPLAAGHAWIEGRAEADAVDEETGLARAEIVDDGPVARRGLDAHHADIHAEGPARDPHSRHTRPVRRPREPG
jgi:uncharacterized protein (TIGR00369 family)